MTDKRLRFLAGTILGLFLVCGAGFGLHGRGAREVSRSSRDVARLGGLSRSDERTPYDPGLIARTIAFWEQQSERDREGALERRELAGAYLARQRETGDIADAVKAEEAARQSLKILPHNNTDALVKLSRSLLAQHRFPEAMEAAQCAAAYDPKANRLLADIQIELGDYDAAERTLATVPRVADDLNYYAVAARLEAINGKPEVALRLLRQAQSLAVGRPDLPAETVAWYHVTVGHALIELGRLDEGELACREALAVFPRDYRAMTATAEAAAWRGDWRGAVEWGTRAVEIASQNPTALKLLADANAALGMDQEAQRQRQRLKELAHSCPRIYDRNWATFCADNGCDLDEALTLARKDLELRRDIHAYDALAWVCFKKDMLAEAERMMQKALARGTREATLLYHAGMIARAGGDRERAKDCFTRAREINPHSIPLRWLRWMDSQAGAAPRGTPPSKADR
jgi:tetratricopeptide (TPR) repeat protein